MVRRLFYDEGSSNSNEEEPLIPDQLPDIDGSSAPKSDSSTSSGKAKSGYVSGSSDRPEQNDFEPWLGSSARGNTPFGQGEPSGFDPTWDIPRFGEDRRGRGSGPFQNANYRQQVGVNSRPGMELSDGFHAYAGFWRRFLALMIDGIMLTIVFELTLSINNSKTTGSSLVSFLINLVYFTLLLGGPSGQSVGCKLTKIRLLAVDGSVAGYRKALLRQLYSIISGLTFLLGYLMMLFTPRRQTLHDMMAGTIVVDVRAMNIDR